MTNHHILYRKPARQRPGEVPGNIILAAITEGVCRAMHVKEWVTWWERDSDGWIFDGNYFADFEDALRDFDRRQ